MKKSFLIVLACFFCVFCCSCQQDKVNNQSNFSETVAHQDPVVTEALGLIEKGEIEAAYKLLYSKGATTAAEEMLGKFKVVYSEESTNYKSGSSYKIEYEYDDEGNLIKKAFIDDEDGTSTHYYEYKQGKLVTDTYEDNKGDRYVSEYTYDENQNLIKYRSVLSAGRINDVEYTYDEKGNVITETQKHSWGNYSRVQYFYNDENVLIREESVFDEDPNASEKRIVDYVYDANGLLMKEVLNTPTYVDFVQREYEYDENGRKILDRYNYSSSSTEITYTYNEKDQLVKEIRTRLVGNDKNVTAYYYDDNGNLIKETLNKSERVTEYSGFLYFYCP